MFILSGVLFEIPWKENLKLDCDLQILSAYDTGAKIFKASLDMFNDV